MSIESVMVDTIMTKDVKTVKPAQTFKSVASMMSQNNIGSIVIIETENNLPAGIITERDVVRIAGTTEILLAHLVASDIMSKPVITINSKSSIKDAIETMQLK